MRKPFPAMQETFSLFFRRKDLNRSIQALRHLANEVSFIVLYKPPRHCNLIAVVRIRASAVLSADWSDK